MGSDIIRIGARTFTRGRALQLGLIDADGNLTENAAIDSRSQQAAMRNQRRADWRKRQGLDIEVERKALKPLRPKNVTPAGEEVTDPAVLAAIAEKEGVPQTKGRRKLEDPIEARRKAMIEESLLAHGVAPEDL